MRLLQSFQFSILLNRIAFALTLILGIIGFYFLLQLQNEFLVIAINLAFIILSLLPSFVYLLFVRRQKINVPVLFGGIFLGVIQIGAIVFYSATTNFHLFTSAIYVTLIPASVFSYVWGYAVGSIVNKKRKA